MKTADFDYPLPPELIAQAPLPERDQSRLLVLDRATGQRQHRQFHDLPQFLRAGDLLVFNDSKVIPARLRGRKAGTGGRFELLLLEENAANDWWVMFRPAKGVRAGTRLRFLDASGAPAPLEATVLDKNREGHCRLRFAGADNVLELLDDIGEVPLPPYIVRPPNTGAVNDSLRYQTVYARHPGSVAAPTAGLHFTPALLAALAAAGVETCFVTLHVGLGTFAPVKTEDLAEHPMHAEHYLLTPEAAGQIQAARQAGRRILAVGTTTVRVLESAAAQGQGALPAGAGQTRLFIHPPCQFRLVNALLTNFHLPKSTLLMLACAFAAPGATTGREWVLSAYADAIRLRYRFFSYGDAMLIL